MSRYAALAELLGAQKGQTWRVTFRELESLLDVKLPPSARKYPAWWSNDPSNNPMTRIWLSVGWRTEQVDVPGETLVFRRAIPRELERKAFGLSGGTTPLLETKSADFGLEDRPRIFERAGANVGMGRRNDIMSLETGAEFGAKRKARFEDLYGCMKGTIKIMPGVDVTAPVYTDEEWSEIEAESDRNWDEMMRSGPSSKDRK